MNDVNWDEPINQKILQDCHRCNDFIITDQKDELALFMYDHYGKDGIRKCTVPDDDEPTTDGSIHQSSNG